MEIHRVLDHAPAAIREGWSEDWGPLVAFADTSKKGDGSFGFVVAEDAVVRVDAGDYKVFPYIELLSVAVQSGRLWLAASPPRGYDAEAGACLDSTRLEGVPVPDALIADLTAALGAADCTPSGLKRAAIQRLADEVGAMARKAPEPAGKLEGLAQRANVLVKLNDAALDASFTAGVLSGDPDWSGTPAVLRLTATGLSCLACEGLRLGQNEPSDARLDYLAATVKAAARSLVMARLRDVTLASDLPPEVRRAVAALSFSGAAADLSEAEAWLRKVRDLGPSWADLAEVLESLARWDGSGTDAPMAEARLTSLAEKLESSAVLDPAALASVVVTIEEGRLRTDAVGAAARHRDAVARLLDQPGATTDDLLVALMTNMTARHKAAHPDLDVLIARLGERLEEAGDGHPLYLAMRTIFAEEGIGAAHGWRPTAFDRDHRQYLTTQTFAALIVTAHGAGEVAWDAQALLASSLHRPEHEFAEYDNTMMLGLAGCGIFTVVLLPFAWMSTVLIGRCEATFEDFWGTFDGGVYQCLGLVGDVGYTMYSVIFVCLALGSVYLMFKHGRLGCFGGVVVMLLWAGANFVLGWVGAAIIY